MAVFIAKCLLNREAWFSNNENTNPSLDSDEFFCGAGAAKGSSTDTDGGGT